MTWEQIGQKIRKAREEVGITQEALAKHLGVSRPVVSNIEAGKRPIDLDELLKIADYLGHSPQYFLNLDAVEDADEVKILYRTDGLTEADREKLAWFFAFLREYMFIRRVMDVEGVG
ncbi:MAG: helix-turn-helix transcriptional regulator [Alicyclobacillaceae bacterium]|nr:helix-turn-helix transcriptional regulator [Alicyclobacillaceae bacterium]